MTRPSVPGMVGALFDLAVNRVLGNYVGFKPRRPHALVIPRFVVIEKRMDSFLEHLDRQIDPAILAHPAVIADETTWRLVGQRVHAELAARGLKPKRLLVASNAYSEVQAAVQGLSRAPRWYRRDPRCLDRRLYGPKRASVVFAVGGGTVIDVAKLVARQLHVPCISVPTSLANDGICSPFAVINPGEVIPDLAQVTVRANTPLGILIALDHIRSPDAEEGGFFAEMVRSGVGDIVSNITAVMDWELAAASGREELDYTALLQARSAGEVILHRVAEGCSLADEEFLLTLAAALISSGEAMTRVGSSRPASGFEHKMYHAYSNLLRFPTRASHGVLVSVGTLVSAHAHGRHEQTIRRAFEIAGLPVDEAGLAAYDLEPARVEESIAHAASIKPERYTILEHLGPDAVIEAFREAFRLGPSRV